MDPLLVITNSDAGTADEDNLATALDVLRTGASVEVAATSSPGELDSVLHRSGTRRIVVAGGDGSMHAVVAALHRRNELKDRVIGLIPLGTGNDFARGNDIPLDPAEAAGVILNGEPRPVDLIVDELGEIVVNNVHVGAGAQASRRGHRWKQRLGSIGVGRANLGKLGYPIGAVLAAFHPPELRLRVTVDDTIVNDLDTPVLMVALGNGAQVGGGTELTPEADPEDGRIDVMVSRVGRPLGQARLRRPPAPRRAPRARRRALSPGRNVTVSGEQFWCSADGEIAAPSVAGPGGSSRRRTA